MSETWREWRLYSYSPDHYERAPGPKPPKAAELSGDGAWATVFADDGRTVLAVWTRDRMPTRESLARDADARRARSR